MNTHGIQPHDYNGYIGEYPGTLPYRERISSNSLSFKYRIFDFELNSVVLEQLRGREWEYDYSSNEPSEKLVVPNPALIELNSLQWDHKNSWIDSHGRPKVKYVNSSKAGWKALIIKKDVMDHYLRQSDLALVWFSFESKRIVTGFGSHRFLGELERRSAFSLFGGQIRFLGDSIRILQPGKDVNDAYVEHRTTRKG